MSEQESVDVSSLGRRLKGFVEEAERLMDQRQDITDTLTALFRAAKDGGFSVNAMRELIKRRAMDPRVRADFDATLEVYTSAAGEDRYRIIEGSAIRPELPPPGPKLSAKEKELTEALAWAGTPASERAH